MDIKERIKTFAEDVRPFYIVDHENGTFSLCLPLDFWEGEYKDFCQDAFDAFAIENCEPPIDGRYSTYGNGYDWQAAFQEAFKDDPNISKILFDSEAGGFFCYCHNLDVLENFGKRFSTLCRDTNRFIPIVSAGIRNTELREAEQEQLMNSVKGQLMTHPQATFEIMTPYGDIRVTPNISQKLLDGEMPTVSIGGAQYAAYELLDQPITGVQADLFDPSLIRMKTEEAPELEEAMPLMM